MRYKYVLGSWQSVNTYQVLHPYFISFEMEEQALKPIFAHTGFFPTHFSFYPLVSKFLDKRNYVLKKTLWSFSLCDLRLFLLL